ncbi:MAG: hypothetical protein JST54_12870 [Deltaproteobacteria bacterium]|nr:hypothetical protein [Deltaproteobacteria bacterium]
MSERKRNETTTKALEWLDQDPYPSAPNGLLANHVELPANPPQALSPSGWSEGANCARSLWNAGRQVLLYWNPGRIEQEALRRAHDNAPPSTIALEVQALTALYIGLTEMLVTSMDVTAGGHGHRLTLHLEAFREILLALERRAATAEARSLDLRLRLEFQKTRDSIENKETASALAAAIKYAADHPDPGGLTKAIADVRDRLEPMERKMSVVERETTFLADRLTDEFAKGLLPMEQAKKFATSMRDALVKQGFVGLAMAVEKFIMS